ncbi:MAG TPA: hypothetical protein VFL91_29175, partial [Thermomicrobiales bacterium]|nr:hypothetical protein [Thermomicrobiales bacterium]
MRDKDQYIGRLFELELLAEFVRARLTPEIVGGPERKRPDFRVSVDGRDVYVEARHRGVARA